MTRNKILRKLVVAAVIVTLTPLQAFAAECLESSIDFEEGSPRLGEVEGFADRSIRTDIVGTFLWVQYHDGEIVSVELPATEPTGVSVCLDGTVTFSFASAPDNGNEPSVPEPVVYDVGTMFDLPLSRVTYSPV